MQTSTLLIQVSLFIFLSFISSPKDIDYSTMHSQVNILPAVSHFTASYKYVSLLRDKCFNIFFIIYGILAKLSYASSSFAAAI